MHVVQLLAVCHPCAERQAVSAARCSFDYVGSRRGNTFPSRQTDHSKHTTGSSHRNQSHSSRASTESCPVTQKKAQTRRHRKGMPQMCLIPKPIAHEAEPQRARKQSVVSPTTRHTFVLLVSARRNLAVLERANLPLDTLSRHVGKRRRNANRQLHR